MLFHKRMLTKTFLAKKPFMKQHYELFMNGIRLFFYKQTLIKTFLAKKPFMKQQIQTVYKQLKKDCL